MKKIDHLLAAFGLRRFNKSPRRAGKRYWSGQVNRLSTDWQPTMTSSDDSISGNVRNLISRARELERNNDYARKYLASAENNILGWDGFKLQMKVRTARGLPDKRANDIIENAWSRWGNKKFCTLSKADDWVEVQKLVIRTALRDGGVFCRKIRDKNHEFGFTIELLEYDYLDVERNGWTESGNQVFMGIEKDLNGTVVAYHMFKSNPRSTLSLGTADRIRVPADNIIHYFFKERVSQSIGVTQMCSAMYRMHFLEKYEQAEIGAARKGAEKGGYFQSEKGEKWEGDEEVSLDEDGNKVVSTLNDFEPQSFDELPPGMTFIPYDPKHPNQAYESFVKTSLLGISAGLNIDYPTLTNDLSKANYSSMRSGKLESQETWKGMQGHQIRNFVLDVFYEWLPMAMLRRAVNLPIESIDRYNKPLFRGRRWTWVDPEKDLKANVIAIQEGLDTRTNIAAQSGSDFEENIEIMKAEQELAEAAGVKLGAPAPKEPKVKKPDPDGDTEEDVNTEDD